MSEIVPDVSTAEQLGAFTASRLLYAYLSDDEAVWETEWKAAWSELHTDDPDEDSAREDEVIGYLIAWLSDELVRTYGKQEALERARVETWRNAPAFRRLQEAIKPSAPWVP